MIKGIGIDIVELKRIEASMKKSDRFALRILTKVEWQVYEDLNAERRKVEYLAGRFAAKEACSKAFGTGIGSKLSFQDIEITTEKSGAPKLEVIGMKKSKLFVSISHSETYAVAQVIIEE
ncbi:holo-ACP synthase [Aquibacillus koreensis]|uniref:Holo-[acyl-carrier-protein] synthase n=1 Tax=Aquibacillus koreensis TaxID=279446 RepID=A0A9X3WRS1_9BACI|nr:holo-ACP synthase [Aquibacillus koreensis]MCT2534957.1 holo-ACP synthase [Aquibacillus koreensis]MDC3422149.1 holo-ACP synthase [Aquibacillus koreensis]